MKVEDLYAHLETCEECYGEPPEVFDFCAIGRELLYEAADQLPEWWQRELARILRKEELQREADENFRFYATSEEP